MGSAQYCRLTCLSEFIAYFSIISLSHQLQNALRTNSGRCKKLAYSKWFLLKFISEQLWKYISQKSVKEIANKLKKYSIIKKYLQLFKIITKTSAKSQSLIYRLNVIVNPYLKRKSHEAPVDLPTKRRSLRKLNLSLNLVVFVISKKNLSPPKS
ncbi:hypothetical protein BpHYR1_054013 [Brachionus plicatilis]|uniref:Uncharacterized protein n=1 Tax=Brachionus plicatilis TaxID=10195 RepID=A0A3M7PVM7_BRAPC|nr:hypothetical protein BpHYR1_054013 [Brachionus plicatilis]